MPETSKPQAPYFGEARSAAGTGASPLAIAALAVGLWAALVALSAGAAPRAATAAAASRMFRRTAVIGVSRDALEGSDRFNPVAESKKRGIFVPRKGRRRYPSGSSRS